MERELFSRRVVDHRLKTRVELNRMPPPVQRRNMPATKQGGAPKVNGFKLGRVC